MSSGPAVPEKYCTPRIPSPEPNAAARHVTADLSPEGVEVDEAA